MTSNPYSTRRTKHHAPLPERRLTMARRMPQLNTARALLFIVGILAMSFGAMMGYTEHLKLNGMLETEAAFSRGSEQSAVTVAKMHAASNAEQRVNLIIGGFGLAVALLARFLYHHPTSFPIIGLVLLVIAFVALLFFNTSENPVLYILAAFLMLGAFIVAIRAGQQFRVSYARMGRAHE